MKYLYYYFFNQALKIYFIFFLFCLQSINAQDLTYYHNKEYKFRIRFPKGWEIKDGAGEHIVKKATKGASGIQIYVKDLLDDPNIINEVKNSKEFKSYSINQIKNLLRKEFDARNISKEELLEIINPSIEVMRYNFHNCKIIEKKISHISNVKAVFVKYSHTAKILDSEINMIGFQYFTLRNGKTFSVGGSSKKEDFENINPILLKSISSFMFEDWDDYNLEDFE